MDGNDFAAIEINAACLNTNSSMGAKGSEDVTFSYQQNGNSVIKKTQPWQMLSPHLAKALKACYD